MNIVLIGMPGAGKSTLGVLLAKALGMGFIDTDIMIQEKTGRLLQSIIDNEGIESFLKVEEKVISELKTNNCVIATGGSAVYSEKAMRALKEGSLIIYLHAEFEEIDRRLRNIATRGIVIKKGSSLQEIYDERLPLYLKYGDKTIDLKGKGIEESLGEIVGYVKAYL